ncbi:hypothetical protein [Planococcus salinarum]|uniref:hypothetical protein n=1 Tax=Planococcus salinarum TaxID=622695 RepID=UPI0012B689BE|nr:hypothetical protein [Planococcus salinarum]
MWALIISGVTFIAAIVISLGKISERGNDIAAGHREELLARETADEESGIEQ